MSSPNQVLSVFRYARTPVITKICSTQNHTGTYQYEQINFRKISFQADIINILYCNLSKS